MTSHASKGAFRIAIAGLGTVGGGVVKALAARQDELSQRAGRPLLLTAVSARDRKKARGFDIPGWSDDPLALATGDADCVVELIGGDEGVARQLVETALTNGKHVVTANKALLAKHGRALALLAEEKGVTLKFEAAAAGGIPIVKVLREDLIAHGVDAVKGILNGTCNFILTEMERSGRGFDEVLAEAQGAQAGPAGESRIRQRAGTGRGFGRRHHPHHRRRHRLRQRVWLPHQAPGHGTPRGGRHRPEGPACAGARRFSAGQCQRRRQRRAGGCG
jgi:hypothetical protein